MPNAVCTYPRLWTAIAMVGALVLAGCVEAPWESGGHSREPPPYQGTRLEGPALDFRLTDQRGASVALSDFQGRVVALAFLDPNCTDVCPLTAFQFRQAHEALGEDASRVAFLAVNVNPEAASVAGVAEATRKWGVGILPDWHFLTGSEDQLQPIWQEYHVHAGAAKHGKPGEVQHSMGVYLIDQEGGKYQYISAYYEGAPPLSELLVQHVRILLER